MSVRSRLYHMDYDRVRVADPAAADIIARVVDGPENEDVNAEAAAGIETRSAAYPHDDREWRLVDVE